MLPVNESRAVQARVWWGQRRLHYNVGLVVAAVLGFGCFVLVLAWADSLFPPPPGYRWFDGLKEWALIAAGCLVIFLAIANLCYSLGPLAERVVPFSYVATYRRIAFRLGLGLSLLVPFVIPAAFAVLLLFCSLAGYGRPVRASDLPGTYAANYGPATSTFTLMKDGRFTQTVMVRAPAKVAATAGTWTYDPNHREITFSEDFMIVETGWDGTEELAPDFDHPQQKGLVIEEVRWLLGRLEIGGDGIPWGRVGGEIPWTKQPGKRPR